MLHNGNSRYGNKSRHQSDYDVARSNWEQTLGLYAKPDEALRRTPWPGSRLSGS